MDGVQQTVRYALAGCGEVVAVHTAVGQQVATGTAILEITADKP